MPQVEWCIRTAEVEDIPAISALIARSARSLGAAHYSPEQIEGALQGAWGVDSQLIEDGTYFVCVSRDQIIASGGWSRRKTLFGGDSMPQRVSTFLDPASDAARIRAFFVDPEFARQGIGRALLAHCEAKLQEGGYTRAELVATLPGVRLYEACGYTAGVPFDHPLPHGLSVRFVPMHKTMPAS